MHFLDDLLKSGARSAEEIRQHSIYLKPNRLSNVMERSEFNETETEMGRMTATDDQTEINRQSVTTFGTSASGLGPSDSETVMERESMVSGATSMNRVVADDETELSRDNQVDEAAN